MALTLIEAAKYVAGAGQQYEAAIIEEFARTSALLQALPLKNISGNAYKYNREDTLPGVGFRGVNEGYTESTGIINPQIESLRIAGGDLDVDKFIVDTMGQQERTIQEFMKVKALSLAMTRELIKGDAISNPRSIDGLQVRITGSQLVSNATTGEGALSLYKLDSLIDAVSEPTHLLMNKTMRRRLTVASRSTTLSGFIAYDEDSFGQRISTYNDLPIIEVDDDNLGNQILPFNEAGNGSGTASTSIYCVSMREGGVMGLQNQVGIQTRDLGELEDKPTFRTRVEWYLGMAILHGRSAARLYGITDAAVTA